MHNEKVLLEILNEVGFGKTTPDKFIRAVNETTVDLTAIQFLHVAFNHGIHDVVVALVEKGIDPNSSNKYDLKTPLHCFVTRHWGVKVKPSTVAYLIEKGANVNAQDVNGRTPLLCLLHPDPLPYIGPDDEPDDYDIEADKTLRTEIALQLIDRGARLDKEWGALTLTAAIHFPKVMEALLSKGVSVNGMFTNVSPVYRTIPILRAVYENDVNLVKGLLENGASLNNGVGNLCMALTCVDEYFEGLVKRKRIIAQLLIENGADPGITKRFEENKNLFRYTCRNIEADPAKALEILKSATLDVNLPINKVGYTLLHDAAQSGYVEVMEELIRQGADVNWQDGEKGNTPLHFHMENFSAAGIELLLKAGADINRKNLKGEIAIQEFRFYSETPEAIEALQVILNYNPDLSGRNGSKILNNVIEGSVAPKLLIDRGVDIQDSAEMAAYRGNAEVYFYMVEKGLDVTQNALSIAGSTIGHKDKRQEREKIFQHVLPFIKDLDQPAEFSYEHRLLHLCASQDLDTIAEALIKRGANPDVTSKNNLTPLWSAMWQKSYATAKVLIAAGASLAGTRGSEYLFMAIKSKSAKGVTLLIENGVDISTPKEDIFPLQQAVKDSQAPIVKSLLAAGANPNLKTEKETYPLITAIKKRHELITHMLLLHGADVNLPADKKSTIKALAMKSKNPPIAAMVQLNLKELKAFKPHQDVLRFVNKRMLFAEGAPKWNDAIKAQMKALFEKRTPESIQEEFGEMEYFDVVDASGKGIYQLMLCVFGDGGLFIYGKKTIVGSLVQHGFECVKKMPQDAEAELRQMLDDAYQNVDGKIFHVNFTH